MSVTILLVTARGSWSDGVGALLEAEGLSVSWPVDSSDVSIAHAADVADFALVDIERKAENGASLCAALRVRSSIPIMVVGRREDELGIVNALAAGADAFVPLDATPREVLARVRSLQRRIPSLPKRRTGALEHGVITIDLRTRVARLQGLTIELAVPEFEILEALIRRPGRVVPRGELLAALGLARTDGHLLDLHVRRLRDKLEAVDERRMIRTVRSVGFQLDDLGTADGEPSASAEREMVTTS